MSDSAFIGPYLRVLKPRTTDGISPLIINDELQYKEVHLPLSARKQLEAENLKLPNYLKMKIEQVSNISIDGPASPEGEQIDDAPKTVKKKR